MEVIVIAINNGVEGWELREYPNPNKATEAILNGRVLGPFRVLTPCVLTIQEQECNQED